MKVLLSNASLCSFAGTELYVRDLAIGLRDRGIQVAVFSPELGAVADGISKAGIFVTDKLEDLQFIPDIIHAHHAVPATMLLDFFPAVPAIYVLHDRTSPQDTPPRHSRIMKYLASDYNTLDRLLIDEAIPVSLTAVHFNWADTNKFRLREQWNKKPERALLFSNYANEQNYFTEVKAACRKSGLSFDCVGMGIGRVVREPEKILGNYDIVFGKAKAAMEAMATGAAVIACDFRGLGGMVTKENFRQYREYNFGMRILSRPVTKEALMKEIASYDPGNAKEVAIMLRAEGGLDKYIDGLLNHYHDALRLWNTMIPDGNRGMQSVYSSLDEKLRHMNQVLLSKLESQQKTIDRMQREIGLLKETPFHKAVRLVRRKLKKNAG